MAAYSFNSNSSVGHGLGSLYDPFLGGFNGVLRGGSASQSLVLDNERRELVKAPVKVGKKEVSEAKALAALKSHSEAERRRRERINAHLDTLRGLVPCNGKEKSGLKFIRSLQKDKEGGQRETISVLELTSDDIDAWIVGQHASSSPMDVHEMDKATLLAEVISQVKELKKDAMEASKGFLIPMDADEVKVEPCNDEAGDANFLFKASICCEYRSELLSEIRQALDALPLRMLTAEISTLGGRLKNVFVFTNCKEGNINNAEASQLLANAVYQALNSVLEKASLSPEYSPRTTLPNKRQRTSFFESSSSSY